MLIFRRGRRASLLMHISFGGKALEITAIAKLIPELIPIITHFGTKSISQWRKNMELDRQVVQRSVQLGLVSQSGSERFFGTLDDYMLEMHSDKITAVLKSFTLFALRIVPLIQKDPNAQCWWINSEILVQRRHWRSLSRRIIALVSIVIECLEKNFQRNQSNLPGEVKLRAAARETAVMFSGS
jgi:hypothetical protein